MKNPTSPVDPSDSFYIKIYNEIIFISDSGL